MPNLQTSYMNLTLKNPIIVASSGLTNSVDKIAACAEAGAGAVVVKSLFEEVLAGEDWGLKESAPYHPEAQDYLQAQLQLQYGPNEYCSLISEAKKRVDIPVIGSINCVTAKWWVEFAGKIEAAGADGIELNVFSIPTKTDEDGSRKEKLYYEILDTVKKRIKIPVAMKIGQNFSSLPHFAKQLEKHGLDALVLFNRFTEPDIDIHKLRLKTTFSFSNHEDVHAVLRWIAILSDKTEFDLSATTGIHTSDGIIKLILAGASTVQLASVLYKHGVRKISELLKEIEAWMVKYDLQNIPDFRGKVGFSPNFDAELYLRAQFMEKIRDIE